MKSAESAAPPSAGSTDAPDAVLPPTSAPVPPARAAAAPVDNSLDGLSLAKGIVQGQLSDPKKVGVVAAVVAVIAFLLGRRSGRRAAGDRRADPR